MTNNINTNSIKNSQLLGVFLLILLSAIMWSCTYEDIDNTPSIIDKSKTITFTFKIPGGGPKGSGPSTYALSGVDEYEVNQIAVLFFDKNGLFIYQPTYLSSDDIIIDADDGRKLTFTIQVYDNINDMVVLVNSNQILNNALSSIAGGQTREEVLKEIVLANSGKWNATRGSSGYMPIPMWAEVNNLSLGNVMPSNVSIPLVRMVSKIDIALTTTEAQNNFSLESVRLYNYNDKGYVAPYESYWDNTGHVVTAPSIPLSANKPSDPVNSPLVYKDAAITKEANRGISCLNEIYTFEAQAGTDLDFINNTCLVVGGKFTGDSETTYYRYDFANTTVAGAEETTDYYSLLRNHNYKINITKVKGSGLPSAEEAFNSRSINMEATVLQWNNGEIGDINFDGQYMLGLSEGEFTFSREVRNAVSTDNKLSITTDYPTGWKVEKIVDASGVNINSATNTAKGWLSLTPNIGASGTTTNSQLILSENNSGSVRKGFIHISAGRLIYIVKVDQLATANLSVSITNLSNVPIDTLHFTGKINVMPVSQLKLSWLPVAASLTYINTPGSNPIVFTSGEGIDMIESIGGVSDVSGNGEKILTIRPTAIQTADAIINLLYERTSTLLYTVSDGTNALFKKLTLRQYIPTLIPIVEPVYKMDGTLQTFHVRSNTKFTVSIKKDPDKIISDLTTIGDVNKEAGTPVRFRVKDDMKTANIIQSDAVVTISSPDNLFDDVDVTLKCKSYDILSESNSYIVAPDGFGLMIPVSRANKSDLGNIKLGANETFSVELEWKDTPNNLSSINSNIKFVGKKGQGTTGYLLVVPGVVQGNALVAVKNVSGKILWSWHIWVTNYIPEITNTFMDRNVGALSNAPDGEKVNGLYYQWGRKDPFPESSNNLYNAAGGTYNTSINTFTGSSNFANSVANPATHYYWASGGTNNNDWYGNTSNINNNLWGPGNQPKTVYDPCPTGWRVPRSSGFNDLVTNSKWDNRGRTATVIGIGGFYPTTGYRDSKGAFLQVGSKGHYWSSEVPDSKMARNLEFISGSISINTKGNYRDVGFSVRCVKE